MRGAYYNENDPKAAAWLRELVKGGHIADGDVDERSISDVRADEVRGYVQCHWFAGIGGWSRSLRLAGWSDDVPVWTGSAPCQPFSTSGRLKGTEDSRDLWPIFFRLISDCLPATIFGEQSERAITFGWLDRLCDDMESSNYAVGAAVLPSCSVGAVHERSRLWWVADSEYRGMEIGRGVAIAVKDSHGRERISGDVSSRVPVQATAVVDARTSSGSQDREAEPAPVLLADDVPVSMAFVRGYGNAIVPKVAAEFIAAYMESRLP